MDRLTTLLAQLHSMTPASIVGKLTTGVLLLVVFDLLVVALLGLAARNRR